MGGRTRRRLMAVALLPMLLVGLAACGDDDEPEASEPAEDETASDGGGDNVLRIEELDYGFDISGSLREGWATIEAENTGDEYHMAGFGKLKEGVTLDDVMEVMASQVPEAEPEEQTLGTVRLASQESDDLPVEQAPAEEGGGEEEGGDPLAQLLEEELGAPGHLLAPGESVSITTDALEAGNYAVICFIPSADGQAHVAKGMINEFTVEESEEPVGEEPEADFDVSFGGGEVTGLDGEPKAGETTFSLTGEGGPHDFSVARADSEDVTFEQLDEHFAQFDEGAPPTRDNLEDGPGVLEFALFDFKPGSKVYVTVDLAAGSYYLGCNYKDDGAEEGHNEFVQALIT